MNKLLVILYAILTFFMLGLGMMASRDVLVGIIAGWLVLTFGLDLLFHNREK